MTEVPSKEMVFMPLYIVGEHHVNLLPMAETVYKSLYHVFSDGKVIEEGTLLAFRDITFQ